MGSLSHSRLLLSPPFLTHDPTAGTFKGDGQKKDLSLFFFFSNQTQNTSPYWTLENRNKSEKGCKEKQI